jgi:hypothetical protein
MLANVSETPASSIIIPTSIQASQFGIRSVSHLMIPTVKKVSPSSATMIPAKAIAAKRIARFMDRSIDSESLPSVLRIIS